MFAQAALQRQFTCVTSDLSGDHREDFHFCLCHITQVYVRVGRLCQGTLVVDGPTT
jgi:hypothetical protein